MSIRIEDLYSKESQEKVLADLQSTYQLLGMSPNEYKVPIKVGNNEAECTIKMGWEEPRWIIYLDKSIYELDELILISNVVFVAGDDIRVSVKKLIARDRNTRILEPFMVDELEIYKFKGFNSVTLNKNAKVVLECSYQECVEYIGWIYFFILRKSDIIDKLIIHLSREAFNIFEWRISATGEIEEDVLKCCDLHGLERLFKIERLIHIRFNDTYVQVEGCKNGGVITMDLEYSDSRVDELMKNLADALKKVYEGYENKIDIVWDGE